jgi:hypothetical protein
MDSSQTPLLDKWYVERVANSSDFILKQLNQGVSCNGVLQGCNNPYDCSKKPVWEYFKCIPFSNRCNRLDDSEAFDGALRAAVRSRNARTLLAFTEVPAKALTLQCVSLRGTPPARQTATAIRKSGDIASWGNPGLTLIKTIMEAIAYQDDAFTRLELLSALYEAPLPVFWFDTITSGIQRATELLPQSQFNQQQRQAIFNKLREVEGRVQQLQAEKAVAEAQLATLPPGREVAVGNNVFVNQPGVGLTAKPPGGQKTSWTPYVVLGAVLATGAGLVTVAAVRRKRYL